MSEKKLGYINPAMFAGRIMAHGQVTDLSEAFALSDERVFSIFLKPKEETTETVEMVTCKLALDTTASPYPALIGVWNEGAFVELSASETLLTNYDVYWGAAAKVTMGGVV